ncbi:hypothetical protein G7084_01475 [Weissella coleopterorum]|uniref:Uncharacterized protein n=1 Tax=Weissella coleopterorum TaxID=2714949 RepID=A0A6G8AYM5_9LACO|nr:hypothetical protein [Weissella coleopterorum]QIL50106.1 hypothetical protein G7084_01475 [Weissella coleopterorum]
MKFNTTTVDQINWLASSRMQSFTEQAVANMKSGEVFNKNDVPVGLVVNDVKATADDPMPVAVMYEGWVIADNLPTELTDADKTSLQESGIKFRGEEGAKSEDKPSESAKSSTKGAK